MLGLNMATTLPRFFPLTLERKPRFNDAYAVI
jgi:hypothetical protein